MLFYSFLLLNLRNRFLFFMNILLPIVFLILFGAVFGKQQTGASVAFYSDRELDIDFENWTKLSTVPTNEEIKSNPYDAIIIGKDGKIQVFSKSNLLQIDYELQVFKLRYISKGSTMPVEVVLNDVKVGKELTSLEYIMIGVIAISLLSVGMNAGVSIYSEYVRYGLFKRLSVTPISSLKLLLSCASANMITGIISSFAVLLLSKVIFRANLIVGPSQLPEYLLVVVSSVLVNLALGTIIGLLFKNAAQSVAQIIYTIFIFFSGVYFPIDFLPKTLRLVSYLTTPRYVHLLFQKVYNIPVFDNFSFYMINIIFIFSGITIASIATRKFLRSENR
uniref:ABC transporter permease n=1 Tax=Fervidobacterium pennivorans TaxID=93466 RepID=A0A7V4KEZ0_FERPE